MNHIATTLLACLFLAGCAGGKKTDPTTPSDGTATTATATASGMASTVDEMRAIALPEATCNAPFEVAFADALKRLGPPQVEVTSKMTGTSMYWAIVDEETDRCAWVRARRSTCEEDPMDGLFLVEITGEEHTPDSEIVEADVMEEDPSKQGTMTCGQVAAKR